MAIMHPPSIAHLSGYKHEAECMVFDKCKQLPDDFHVFHSVSFCHSNEGECDFIIFHPAYGYICLEVKGGGVGCRGNRWYSIDRSLQKHKIKNPIRQAQRAMWSLRTFFERQHGTFHGTYCWGVCFPDAIYSSDHFSLELEACYVLDYNKINDIHAWARNLFLARNWRPDRPGLSAEDVQAFLYMLKQDITIPLCIGRLVDEQEEHLADLDIIQEYMLDVFADKPLVAFQGAAGTGKTWLAIKKARRLAQQGKKTLYLCYNHLIAHFVHKRLRDVHNITAESFHNLLFHVIDRFWSFCLPKKDQRRRLYGLVTALNKLDKGNEPPKNLPKGHTFLAMMEIIQALRPGPDYKGFITRNKHLPQKAKTCLLELVPNPDDHTSIYEARMPLAVLHIFASEPDILNMFRFQAILLDEGQDFRPDWCTVIECLLQPADSTLWLFYDDNQAIFQQPENLPIMELLQTQGAGGNLFRLCDNVRNTRNIHEYAVTHSHRGQTAKALDLPGLEPVEVLVHTAREGVAYIQSRLRKLVYEHGIAAQDIVILSNRSFTNSIFTGTRLNEFHLVTQEAYQPSANHVRFRTIHKFKGMEAKVVILVIHKRDTEIAQPRYLTEELLYVGFTRAKHLLYVITVR